MADVKVFQMNDCDCYAAETVEEALAAMAETYCYETTPEGIAAMRAEFDVTDPYALDGETLDRRKVRVDEDVEEVVTFREHLNRMIADDEVPGMFASTEY